MQPGPSASTVGSPRPAPMLARQRQEHILERVAATGGVRVADVVEELGISEMTVRRDITELVTQGLVERVHGGAVAAVPPVRSVVAHSSRSCCAPGWDNREVTR